MLFDQISNDIKEAMKARNQVRLDTLRNIKKVFLEAKTAPGANDTLDDTTAVKLLQKLAKQGKESAAIYAQQNRPDLAEPELAQVSIIEEYLPKALSEDEIETIVREIISQTGASGMKDMGKVMGLATKQMAGQAEGGAISAVVKRLLTA